MDTMCVIVGRALPCSHDEISGCVTLILRDSSRWLMPDDMRAPSNTVALCFSRCAGVSCFFGIVMCCPIASGYLLPVMIAPDVARQLETPPPLWYRYAATFRLHDGLCSISILPYLYRQILAVSDFQLLLI